MTKANEIPTGELFADLQVSLTEIFLIELLNDEEFINEQRDRLDGNFRVRDAIEAIMYKRFTREDIEKFLKDGYPRAVDVSEELAAWDAWVNRPAKLTNSIDDDGLAF